MSFFKRKKRSILYTLFYLSVILGGSHAYLLGKNGIDPEVPLFLQLAGLISVLLLAFGTFYEIYFGRSRPYR